ncbi:acetylglutamate kinase [Zhaonella formicivorans]|jgi:acetylglutamate kinase|uniref:acetylglutamate kinase n=1 Tax=Zhaonella formicivorans TaxID=2528593 RepID=UPI0010E1DF7B|nr:acetylglutamate kinase [Zhaonella formicivorans]
MVLTALEKAGILVEALPYIKKFYGKTVVIKYGGHAMLNEELKKAVMQDVILMKFVGMNPVIVHGGGPEINTMLKRLGKKSEFVSGMRVTDAETMEVVEMVLVGKVNKDIVAGINRFGGKAVGLCGKDGQLIEAYKKLEKHLDENGEEVAIDLGFVGEVERINPQIIKTLVAQDYIPVIAPIGVGPEGESYNINADYVAGEIAAALQADKFVLLTDVEGIFENYEDKDSLISSLNINDVPALIKRGVISGGMIPKVQCCVKALNEGVEKAHIIDGRLPHSILLEIFTDQGIGTMVVK